MRTEGRSIWFSNILSECRRGNLSYQNYAFLHGFPTDCSGNSEECLNETCRQFGKNMKQEYMARLRKHSEEMLDYQEFWRAAHANFECHACQNERKRRARVKHCTSMSAMTEAQTIAILASERFREARYIGEYNKAVTKHAHERSVALSLIHI